MKTLHLITRRDELVAEIIEAEGVEASVEVHDLTTETDYRELVEKIFAADTIHVW
jgi:hypothetical protein